MSDQTILPLCEGPYTVCLSSVWSTPLTLPLTLHYFDSEPVAVKQQVIMCSTGLTAGQAACWVVSAASCRQASLTTQAGIKT